MPADPAWVPEACTLPTVEQPLRVAEFDDLFTQALRDVQRPAVTRLRLTFDPASGAAARDLVVRESECCSFFAFTVSATATELVIDVEVPDAQVAVLDAIAAHALRSVG
jgi:hypothetical protein